MVFEETLQEYVYQYVHLTRHWWTMFANVFLITTNYSMDLVHWDVLLISILLIKNVFAFLITPEDPTEYAILLHQLVHNFNSLTEQHANVLLDISGRTEGVLILAESIKSMTLQFLDVSAKMDMVLPHQADFVKYVL